MRVKRGRHRIVLVFPSAGIAIKVAVIDLVKVIQETTSDIKEGNWRELFFNRFTWHWEIPYGFQAMLFGGIIANWIEWRFYRQTKSQFLQPTYFSFLGLVNVQQAGEPLSLTIEQFWPKIRRLTNNLAFKDAHHFCNSKNFCLSGDKLRMLDYGHRECQEVIRTYDHVLVEYFNL